MSDLGALPLGVRPIPFNFQLLLGAPLRFYRDAPRNARILTKRPSWQRVRAELTSLIVCISLTNLLLGIHDERATSDDRLV